MKKWKEKGFTFLELLLVLSVVSVLTMLVIPIGQKWIQAASEEDAINGLVSTIYGMQSYAIAHKIYTKVEFVVLDGKTYYEGSSSKDVVYSKVYLPMGMRISNSSNVQMIEFHPNGNIIKFGTLTLITKSGVIDIKFQFQRGRMIISESEGLFMARNDSYTRSTRRHLWNASPARNKNNIWAI